MLDLVYPTQKIFCIRYNETYKTIGIIYKAFLTPRLLMVLNSLGKMKKKCITRNGVNIAPNVEKKSKNTRNAKLD